MAKAKKTAPTDYQPKVAPKVHEAVLGNAGSVKKGAEIAQAAAETRRQAGLDVVVCGPDRVANRRLAGEIERNANGSAKCCFPHLSAVAVVTALAAGPATAGRAHVLRDR